MASGLKSSITFWIVNDRTWSRTLRINEFLFIRQEEPIVCNSNNSWWANFIQSKGYNYDTYSFSPNYYIYKLFLRRYFIKKDKSDLKFASSHLFTQILNFHFINKYNRTNKHRLNNAFLEYSRLDNKNLKLKIGHALKLNSTELPEAPKVSISLKSHPFVIFVTRVVFTKEYFCRKFNLGSFRSQIDY